ncbi:MAG: hypothetical protein CME68_11055 [Halobacteriovoraceae bacterium]|nr:hypothetical protein [Halobacteriovoraceae bacterium]
MKHFEKIGLKSYKLLSILFCALGDIIVLTYLWQKFSNFNNIKPLIMLNLKLYNLSERDLPQSFFKEIHQVMMNTLSITCILIVIFHAVIYFFFYREKKSAWLYVKILTLLGALGSPLLALPHIQQPISLGFSILLLSFLYLWVFVGFFSFEAKRGTTN